MKARGALGNLLLALASVIVFALFCEFVVFRFVLAPSDIPANAYVDGLLRYAPGQEGVYRKRNAVEARYRINAQGWNAPKDYVAARIGKPCRVVLVGDSYVEAFQVDVDASFAEKLEDALGRERAEVYRFGVSGAPLSQYLAMLEREAAAFGPDVIVVNLVHNDFIESYRPLAGRFTRSFLTLAVEDGKVMGERPGEIYVPPAFGDGLRLSATFRFFYYRWGVTPQGLIAAFRAQGDGAPRHEANIDVAELGRERANIAAATSHLFRRIKAVGDARGVPVLIAIDGVREAIYAGQDASAIEALALNRLVRDIGARLGIDVLDLHPVFEARWKAERERFDFGADDGHWNRRGHEVAAEAIGGRLRLMPPPCGG